MKIYDFNSVIGNRVNVDYLKRVSTSSKLPKLLMFYGQPGTGKTTSARIVSMMQTCLNPNSSGPCMKCARCQVNLAHFEKGAKGEYVQHKDLGQFNSRDDIKDLIKEIFVLDTDNSVYILEEVHVLSKGQQTALLQELDRMDDSTHIILCTTEFYKCIEPLRSRSIQFSFNRLNKSESRLLIERNKGDLNLTNKMVDEIISKGRGIPRDMVNILEFLKGVGKINENDLKEFLGLVPSEIYLEIFKNAKVSFFEYVGLVKEAVEQFDPINFLSGLKSFLRELTYYKSGVLTLDGSSHGFKALVSDISMSTLVNICKYVATLPSDPNIDDLELSMTVIYGSLVGKKRPANMIEPVNQAQAVVEKKRTEVNAAVMANESVNQSVSFQKLNSSNINRIVRE